MRERHFYWTGNHRVLTQIDHEPPWYGIERTPDSWGRELFDQVVRTPEQKLMKGVLEEALFTFEANFKLLGTRAKRLTKEVEDWISDPSDYDLFSFESICSHLGLEPNYLRRKLKEKKAGLLTSSIQAYQKLKAREVA